MTDLIINAWKDGAALQVKAHAGARRDGVDGLHDGMMKVMVTAAPEKGKANQAIARLLAKRADVPIGKVELLSGEAGRLKRFGFRGLGPDELRERLAKPR